MKLGKKNKLRIDRLRPPGAYLEDESGNEVLLPTKYLLDDHKVGSEVSVFVYKDSEDRIIATTLEPNIKLDEFGYLKVKDVNAYGAFLDWGIEKDLMVPFREQIGKMEKGKSYLVYVLMDPKTERLLATQKINKFLEKEIDHLEVNEEVDLLIGDPTDLGINVIVNQKHKGLLFHNEIFEDLLIGDRTKGYIKNLREDGKLDVTLRKAGIENLEEGAEKILTHLKENEGFLSLTDKSTPEEIQFELQMSKKNFKRSLGILYKKRMISLEKDGIRLKD